MKVVVDANILISFLLTKGPTISKIINYWKNKKITILVSEEILLEIRQVLERLVAGELIESGAAEALFRRLKEDAENVVSLSYIDISIDKKDNRYLACAKDGKADYLITGDKKHLLKLKKFEEIKIVSPKEFVDLMEKS